MTRQTKRRLLNVCCWGPPLILVFGGGASLFFFVAVLSVFAVGDNLIWWPTPALEKHVQFTPWRPACREDIESGDADFERYIAREGRIRYAFRDVWLVQVRDIKGEYGDRVSKLRLPVWKAGVVAAVMGVLAASCLWLVLWRALIRILLITPEHATAH